MSLPPSLCELRRTSRSRGLRHRACITAMRKLPVVLLCRTSSGLTKSVNPKYSPPRPASHEGRTRRHEREAGCDGRYRAQSTKRARRVRRSRVVPTPRRWCLGRRHPDDGGKQARSPGRARSSREDHRAGRAGSVRLYLWFLPRATLSHGGHGPQPRSGLPCALSFAGGWIGRTTRAHGAAGTLQRANLPAR